MKIKAIMNFVSGRYEANRGEVIEVPDEVGTKLVNYKLAEKAPEKSGTASNSAAKVAGGETSTPAKKTAGTSKTAVKKPATK